jgi:outer membrane protein TolC
MTAAHIHDTSAPHLRGSTLALVLGVVLAMVSRGAHAQTTPPSGPSELTLASALREIAANSSASVMAGLEVAAARENTKHIQAAYYPTVSLDVGHLNRDHQVVARFGALSAPELERDFFEGEIDATQLLWDGGRRSSGLKAAQTLEGAAARRGEASVRSTQLEGLKTYLQILVHKAQRLVVAQRTASLQDHLREVRDLFDQGVVARNDLLATEVRLRTVKDQNSQLDNAEAVAAQALNRLLGRSPSDALVLPAALPSPPPLSASLDELKRRAVGRNQQVLALRARAAAEEAAVKARQADSYPTVIAQLSHTYQQNQYLVYPNANVLFFGLNWQAYDGGARKSGVREAQFAAAKTAQEILDLERALQIQVEQAYRDYQQALKEAGTAETNVTAAVENLRIEEDQYKSGLARTTDVLDAESVLADSRFALVNQHYTAYLKQGMLLDASGEDLPEFFATVTPGRLEH